MKIRKTISFLVALALVLSLVNVPVQAATSGAWVLTEHYIVSDEGYSDTGSTSYELSYDYNEKDGTVYCNKLVKFSNIDGYFESMFHGSCSIPKQTVKPGEVLKLKVTSTIESNSLDGMLESNNCVVREKGYALYFRDENDYSHYYIESWTGPASNNKMSDSATVSYELPSSPKEGDLFEIEFNFAGGTTHSGTINVYWTYQYKTNILNAPGTTSIKSASAKKNVLTVKAKSIKCDGYQIQVSNYSDFRDNTDSALNTLTYYGSSVKASFDNKILNKTKYIRVRAFNKADNEIAFGAWSKVKKISK